MSRLASKLRPFHARIKDLVQEKNAPGLSVAVRRGDDLWTSAAGIANLDTGQPVLAETKFLIGSNTKVMTATLIMQLVDQGRVALEAPAVTYLPNLKLADAGVEQITIRHLLNHTSGIDGDYFRDFGRGDDAMRRYVESLERVHLLHEPGRMFSYCNAGWPVLGRILEKLHELPFHQVLRQKLFAPIGLTEEALLPEESILGHSAVGHVPRPGGGLRVTPVYLLPHAMGPAGSVANLSARAMTQFAQLHLDGGRAPDGTRVLSEASVRLMQETTVTIPNPLLPNGCGLGWRTIQAGRHRRIEHGGGTTGQLTTFWALPDEGLSFAGFTNGPAGSAIANRILEEIAAELVGLEPTPEPRPADPAPALNLDPYTGTYAALMGKVEISAANGRLSMKMRPTQDEPGEAPDLPPVPLAAMDDTFFVGRNPFMDTGMPIAIGFIEKDARGVPDFLFMGRAMRRVRAP